MQNYQKDTLLDSLETMEKHISELKEDIASVAMDNRYGTTMPETLAAYSARLAGYIQERRGFCFALSILGYSINWDGGHAVDITKAE